MSLIVKNEGMESPEVQETQVASTPEATPAPETPAETTPEAPAEGTPTPEAPAEGEQAPTDGAAGGDAPIFTPNFKFKVMDKEHEIPERFRALIKDAETQKEVVDILTKAYGLDHAKPKHEKTLKELQTERQSRTQVEQRYQQVEQGYNRLQGMLKKGDIEGFLNFWQIDKEKILRHAAELLRYEEMSPAERAEVDRQRATARKAESLDEQVVNYQRQAVQAQARVREMELDTAISRNDIADVASQYDTRAGQPGAFKARVVRTAQMHALTTRKDISVEQAIQETMTELGYELVDEDQPQAPARKAVAQATPPAQKVVAAVQQKKLPVLPASSGSGSTSPVKKSFNTVEELIAYRESLAKKA
jgi:hypothetical protein